MKAVILVGDGMADRPLSALGGRTPLEAASTPAMDRLARSGALGLFRSIPPGAPLGSAVANLSILGYDPVLHFQGRGVLEAAAMGVELDEGDVALRLNLVTLEGGRIADHSAGFISTEEGALLVAALEEALGGSGPEALSFHRGVDYRHLLVLRGGWASPELQCAPPHDHLGGEAEALLPKALVPGAEKAALRLKEVYRASLDLFGSHPVNRKRRSRGLPPADAAWPWSPGKRPDMPSLEERFGIRGAVITAVDLVKGLGVLAGMTVLDVPGATGLPDTDYEGKVRACLEALEAFDFVYLHVEAPDEASHVRNLGLKIRCIQDLDRSVVGPLMEGLETRGEDFALCLLADHPTYVETGRHGKDPVPVALAGPQAKPDSARRFDERSAAGGGLGVMEGDALIRLVIGR